MRLVKWLSQGVYHKLQNTHFWKSHTSIYTPPLGNLCLHYNHRRWLQYISLYVVHWYISADTQVSIRVEAEEYEREVAPIIVIQTPDPLLRLQVKWSANVIVRLSLKLDGIQRFISMFDGLICCLTFNESQNWAGEAAKIEHEGKLWEKARL